MQSISVASCISTCEGYIPEITVKELPARDLDDLVIERPCLEIIQNSEVINRIQIINGLNEGNTIPEYYCLSGQVRFQPCI